MGYERLGSLAARLHYSEGGDGPVTKCVRHDNK